MSAPKAPQLTPFGYALAGALGGVFSNAVVYPLDTVKTRIQAENSSSGEKGKGKQKLTMTGVLLRVLREEGVSGLYNGFGASMLNTFSMQYAYFFFYSWVRGSYIKRLLSKLPPGSKVPTIGTAMELLLGAIAGALAQIFTIPVSVIATRQQVGAGSKKKAITAAKPSYSAVANPDVDTSDDNSFLGVGRQIIREDGVAGLWLGLKASLVLTVNPSITYGVFERVKNMMLLAKEAAGTGAKLTPFQSFFLGALSKSLATVVTYPYIMAKVRIQAGTASSKEESLPGPSSSSEEKPKSDDAIPLLARVLKEEGFTGWYQGMSAQITKAVLSQALLFMSKDQFEHYALVIMTAAGAA
ncbi:adenine nucleotide transporter [Schizopora paradoxa]|uniref:Adenine nucleotide transporter n=1 Tax=Schizopora paradoxa TaxID=27342 RepID=A0A0H2RZC2_9AGAM|nr:adenine nucleotide transporter [Schizopora paradoxa]